MKLQEAATQVKPPYWLTGLETKYFWYARASKQCSYLITFEMVSVCTVHSDNDYLGALWNGLKAE